MKSCENCIKRKECKLYDNYNGKILPVTLARTCNEYQDAETIRERKEFNRRIKPLKLDETTKEELYAKYIKSVQNGFKCYYCGEKMGLKFENEKSFSIDHVIPRSKGGSDTPQNLIFCCAECNFLKKNSDVDWFLANLDRLKQRKLKRELFKARKHPDDRVRDSLKQIFKLRAVR